MPFPYISYVLKHKVYARENRKKPTMTEKIVRKTMLSERPLGYKFTRQKPLGPYIADFYCSKLLLVIEIDGNSHTGREDYDTRRDSYLASLGIMTIRYTNDDVIFSGNSVYENICAQIKERISGLALDELRGIG